jgi:serine phosphatase RsbU (regulator of sigma subunit)
VQVSVLGFDDAWVSRYADAPLTTVRQPVREQVRLALRLLARRLAGEDVREHRVVATELVIRESCGCRLRRQAVMDGTSAERPIAADPSSAGNAATFAWSSTAEDALRATRIPGAPDGRWPEELVPAFLAAVSGSPRAFLRALGPLIDAVDEVGVLHRVVDVLAEATRRHLDPEARRRAEPVLHAAQIRIAGAAERAPARRKLRVKTLTARLVGTSHHLATVGDLASVAPALAASMPPSDLPACHICLHEPDRRTSARLVMAYDGGRPVGLAAGGEVFPSQRLLPERLESREHRPTYLVFALEFAGHRDGYVVFERGAPDGFLYEGLAGLIGSTLRRLLVLDTLLREAKAREAAEAQRLEHEIKIATEIQTGILPRTMRVDGLEIAAFMRPASQVGGDYYDVIPTADGCWIGIGDVSGHGLTAGLVMLMLQSIVSGLIRRMPEAAPSEVVTIANAAIFENVRVRMDQDEHATFTLLRYSRDGRVAGAGAHELILICRAEGGRIEWFDTPGTWIGLVPDIRGATTDMALDLRPGDLMVLYTDGVTEARSERGEMFGRERLAAALASVQDEPVEAIRDALWSAVEAWSPVRDDDVSILVARHHGSRGDALAGRHLRIDSRQEGHEGN